MSLVARTRANEKAGARETCGLSSSVVGAAPKQTCLSPTRSTTIIRHNSAPEQRNPAGHGGLGRSIVVRTDKDSRVYIPGIALRTFLHRDPNT
jgi:hypothetical protein